MTEFDVSQSVATQLSELWQFHRRPDFLIYVTATYKVVPLHQPTFERIYIAEAENGDIESASIGGIIKHWWMIDDSGFQAVRRPELLGEEQNVFDQRPIIKFFIKNAKIVVGERLGPALICRKRGVLWEKDGRLIVSDLVVAWTCNAGAIDLHG